MAQLQFELGAAGTTIDQAIANLYSIAGEGVRWSPQAVRVRSTGDVGAPVLLKAGDVLNGVSLQPGDTVLLIGQALDATMAYDPDSDGTIRTASPSNGFYTVQPSGPALRAEFANTAAQLARIGVLVAEGTKGAGEIWTLPTAAADIVVGTSSLDFVKIGTGASYAAEVVAARGTFGSLSERLADLAEQINSRERIEAAESRAALYGINDPANIRLFGASAIELDFVAGLYRSGYAVFETPAEIGGYSFTRPSAAMFERAPGVVTSFASGVARTIPGIGMVMEPPATNLLLRSAEFEHSTWIKVALGSGVAPAIASNDAVAPDGTTTADRVTLDLGGGDTGADGSFVRQTFAVMASKGYTSGIYVKGIAGEKILHRHVGGAAYTLHVFSGQWERIGSTEVAASASGMVEIGLIGGLGASSAVSFHIWGAQIEVGDARTNYVPTSAAIATRAGDTAYLDGLGLSTCTIIAEVLLTSGSSNTSRGLRTVFTLFNGTDGRNIITVINNDQGTFGAVVQTNGKQTAYSPVTSVSQQDQVQRVAFRLSQDDVRLAQNGELGKWVFDAAIPDMLPKIGIGTTPLHPGARLGGIVRKIAVIPFALSDRQLNENTGGVPYPPSSITWQRVRKNAAFAHRDSARTFKMGGRQFIARGFQPGPVLFDDIWSSTNGIDYKLVNASPNYEPFSQVNAVGGVIYAWNTQMYRSIDGGQTFTKILDTLPWGSSPGDNPTIVHKGSLLFVHGTGNEPLSQDEGVYRYDPTGNSWAQIAAAPWGARDIAMLADFQGDLYLQGGSRHVPNVPAEQTYSGRTTLNDLWRSRDGGESWEQIVADLPCAPRMWPFLIEFDRRFYLGGGYDNIGAPNHNFDDTWVSDDGVNWQPLQAERPYLERHAPVAYVFNGALYLVSGNANAQAPKQTLADIWRLVS